MRKRVQYVIVLLIICCAYAAVLIFTQERQSSGNAPQISAPQEVLEVSVQDDEELERFDNVILTPHLAWLSEEATAEMVYRSMESCRRFMNGGEIK